MRHSYREFAASAELSPAIECFWSVEAFDAQAKPILPDGCCDLVFRFAKRSAKFKWVGVMTRPHVAVMAAHESIVGARFRPGMLSSVLDIDAPAVADASGELAHCAEWRLLGLDVKLRRSDSVDERVDLLQRTLRPRRSDGRSQSAIDRLVESRGRATMEELLDVAGLGERHLRRSFQSRAGVGPKTLARILRFRAALKAAREGGRNRLTEIALESGYFDQAHMGRDFRQFGGAPPASFTVAESVSY